MKLIIENSYNDPDLKNFIYKSVIPTAQQLFFFLVNNKIVDNYTNYLSERYGKFVSAKLILILGIKSLIIGKTGNDYYIQINPDIFVPKLPAKLINICALINYGNLEVSPYNIFDQIMIKLADMLPQLYREYLGEI